MHAINDMTEFGKIISNSMPALEQLQYIGNGLTSARTNKQTIVSLHLNEKSLRLLLFYVYNL